MTSVALIQLGERHTEIIGGVVTMFMRKNVDKITVYTRSYASSFVPYYKKILNNKKVKWVYINNYSKRDLKKKIEKNNDLYVFLTGYEYEDMKLDPEQSLLVTHITDDIEDYDSWGVCGQIALSPVFDKHKVKNFLNVFKLPPIKRMPKKLEIVIAGLTNPENKDLDALYSLMVKLSNNDNRIGSEEVLFHIINYYDIPYKFKQFEHSGLLKVYINTSAATMFKILRYASYTMVLAKKGSSYHNVQLSGIIPLSISCGTPLICDRELAKIYKLSRPSITYTFTSDYLHRALRNASKKDLNSMRARTIEFRDKKIINNKKAKMPCLG